jgi:hypothetical protein
MIGGGSGEPTYLDLMTSGRIVPVRAMGLLALVVASIGLSKAAAAGIDPIRSAVLVVPLTFLSQRCRSSIG